MKKALLISFVCLIFLTLPAQDTPQNILFIAIDDMNDWIGPLGGNPIAITPNLDQLAAESMVFANAHCASPACSPPGFPS